MGRQPATTPEAQSTFQAWTSPLIAALRSVETASRQLLHVDLFTYLLKGMANQRVAGEFYEVSQLAKFPFEPYWPSAKLRICVTGAGGFIASHLARRLKSEGHYIVACDWKRNEHMPVSASVVHTTSGTFLAGPCARTDPPEHVSAALQQAAAISSANELAVGFPEPKVRQFC